MERIEVTSVKGRAVWTREEFQKLFDDMQDEGNLPQDARVTKLVIEADEPVIVEYE